MEDLCEEVLGRKKIEAQWMELIMRNGNKEAPERYSSPIWIIEDAPSSDCVEIEIPTSSHQIKVITKNKVSILKCLMKSTNTKIKIRSPIFEDEKTTIFICGTEPDIYKAKRELVNYMPIDIIFDIDREYMDIKKIVIIAFNNCLSLTGIKKNKSMVRITMRGQESMVQSMYKVYQEIREIQAKVESQPYLRIIRHAVVLNTDGIFDDLDLDSVIPATIKEYTTSNDSSDNDDDPLQQEDANFVKMPTIESYEKVLGDEEGWIIQKRKKKKLLKCGNAKPAQIIHESNINSESSNQQSSVVIRRPISRVMKIKEITTINKSRKESKAIAKTKTSL